MEKSNGLIYDDVIKGLKEKIRLSRLKTVLTVNVQLLGIYFEIGSTIAKQERQKGWGAKIVVRLSTDLIAEFPDMKGLSPRNLRYMRDFSVAWPELSILQQSAATIDDPQILQQPVAKLPWGHNCLILDKLKSKEERLFYASKAVENGWSRNMLLNQIAGKLFKTQGKLPNNFKHTLPALDSELTQELFKDPYHFIVPHLPENAKERDLENALVMHLTQFLLEMGKGFSYVGRQVHFEQGNKDYYIDLLLYNLKYHFYLVIELKIGEFKPEYSGKMNFYLSLVDQRLKTEAEKPSIGLILCKSKENVTVEYALRDVQKPIGVAGYEINLTRMVPKELKNELPSIKDIETEISKEIKIPQRPVDEKITRLKDLVAGLGREPIEMKRNNVSVRRIFEMILPSLIGRLEKLLKDVMPMFNESYICRSINGKEERYNASRNFETDLVKPGLDGIFSIGLFIHLEGFALGGTNTFELKYYLNFGLEKHKYTVGPSNPRKEFWNERLYKDKWTDEELQQLAERWSELILDEITQDVKKQSNRH